MKKVLMLHGLGGESEEIIVKVFGMFGVQAEFPNIDFVEHWYYDKGNYLCSKMSELYKDVDAIVGLSLGGYLGFVLANHLNKPAILINPSVNRAKSKLNIREFDFDFKITNPQTELFFGELDVDVPPENAIEYLEEIKYDYKDYVVDGMEHGFDIYEFIYILKTSKIFSDLRGIIEE